MVYQKSNNVSKSQQEDNTFNLSLTPNMEPKVLTKFFFTEFITYQINSIYCYATQSWN